MQGLGRAKGINIKAEEADGTSPANVLRSAKEKQKLFKDKGSCPYTNMHQVIKGILD